MLQSNFSISSLYEPDQFSLPWPLEDQSFISDDLESTYNDDDALSVSTFDFNSNSSDIENFNFEELENDIPVSDTFVSSILGNGFADLECVLGNLHNPSLVNNFNSCNVTSENEQYKDFTLSCTKSWSRMSTDEQQNSLFSLSSSVCKMGIDEQLAIIKIIDPDTHISSDTKEFTIDVSLITDSKWQKIQYIFERHVDSITSQKTSMKSRKTSKVSKALARNVSRTSKKPKQKKQISEIDIMRRKQERQGRKEEKSGLFVYEKVVKFTSLEEDEDVNILE